MVPDEMFGSLCHGFQKPDGLMIEGEDEGGAPDKRPPHLCSTPLVVSTTRLQMQL